MNKCKLYCIEMRDSFKSIPGKANITTYAWLSRVYKGYLTTTLHWVDRNLVMHSIVLEFVRFSTPHNTETAATLLADIM